LRDQRSFTGRDFQVLLLWGEDLHQIERAHLQLGIAGLADIQAAQRQGSLSLATKTGIDLAIEEFCAYYFAHMSMIN
jgi:hypothetical protein